MGDPTSSRYVSFVLVFGLVWQCGSGLGHRGVAYSAEPGWLDDAELVDLTHPFDEQTIFWPTERGFQLEKGPAGITAKGYYYAANRFRSAEHGGTHLDAPIHFYKDRRTVDQIPLKQLFGKAVVIDVSAPCAGDPDYEIGIADFRRWEEKHRRQLAGEIVLLRTGFGSRWPKRKEYLGTEETGAEAVAKLHFPGLAPDAARWLTESRAIKAVGIDTASIDRGQSKQFGSHIKLFEHNVPAFENLANLEQLPEEGFTVVALPMKIASGTGAPLRIAAAVPPRGDKRAGAASAVTEENYNRIKAHKGTWTEADVLALLGRPDRYSVQADGVLEMVWEDVNRIRVEFEGGKAAFLWGDFSAKLPSKIVSLDNFRKLRRGMSEAEAEAVFGVPGEKYSGPHSALGNVDPIEDLTVREGATLYVWQKLRRLAVQFTDGKVSGHIWAPYLNVAD